MTPMNKGHRLCQGRHGFNFLGRMIVCMTKHVAGRALHVIQRHHRQSLGLWRRDITEQFLPYDGVSIWINCCFKKNIVHQGGFLSERRCSIKWLLQFAISHLGRLGFEHRVFSAPAFCLCLRIDIVICLYRCTSGIIAAGIDLKTYGNPAPGSMWTERGRRKEMIFRMKRLFFSRVPPGTGLSKD